MRSVLCVVPLGVLVMGACGGAYTEDAQGDASTGPTDASLDASDASDASYASDSADAADASPTCVPAGTLDNDENNCGACGVRCVTSACMLGQCQEKLVFVSTTSFSGNLGGLAMADAACSTLAKAAKLHGVYKAWLSDKTMDAVARLTQSKLRYVRVDGAVVANDWSDLVSGALHVPINRDESGKLVVSSVGSCPGQARVWTSTFADGLYYGDGNRDTSCGMWFSASPQATGGAGDANSTTSTWSSGCGATCDSTIPIYCLEQ